MKKRRHLIYIPILHTEGDAGSLAPSLKQAYLKKFGEKKWGEHVSAIEAMWGAIETGLRSRLLDFAKLKVYQDGLPLCGREREIVSELAGRGLPNYRLVAWLAGKGAEVVGTEDPQLLVAEYQFHKKIAEAKKPREKARLTQEFESAAGDLLVKRDRAISERISKTLGEGETGILFIGLLHRVDEFLPRDIRVEYLIRRLPFRQSLEKQLSA